MPNRVLMARVLERIRLTDQLMIIRIKPEIPFTFKPGQYCTIGVKGIERPYSIASSPHEEAIELLVEIVPEEAVPGPWQVDVGDTVTIRPRANGVFTLEEGYPNQFMVATVTGIAPLISMIRHYIHLKRNSHRFFVFHGASYHDELAYKNEIEGLSMHNGNIVYVPTVSRKEERNRGWLGVRGRVNLIVEGYIDRFSLTPKDTIVYACGHPEMVKDVKRRLGSKGFRIKEEEY